MCIRQKYRLLPIFTILSSHRKGKAREPICLLPYQGCGITTNLSQTTYNAEIQLQGRKIPVLSLERTMLIIVHQRIRSSLISTVTKSRQLDPSPEGRSNVRSGPSIPMHLVCTKRNMPLSSDSLVANLRRSVSEKSISSYMTGSM
jgi:hypothetical protein